MYPHYLGKFLVPSGAEWVPGVTYQPEPPVFVKDSMNPWQQERQRVLFTAEEKAWVEIQTLQKSYRRLMREIQAVMAEFNNTIARIESLTGKKSGIGQITNYASMMYAFAGGPYAWAAGILKFGVDIALSFIKKRKLKKLMKKLEELQGELTALSRQIEAIQAKVTVLVQTGERIRSEQTTAITKDIALTETAYQTRVALDRKRADVLRERNRQAALLPRLAPLAPGGEQYATI